MLKKFIDKNPASIADDHDGTPVFLARNAWHLNKAAEDWSEIRLLKTGNGGGLNRAAERRPRRHGACGRARLGPRNGWPVDLRCINRHSI
jgi:hypothetical protein